MKSILTVINDRNFPPGWEKDIDAFGAVSVRADSLRRFAKVEGIRELQGWAWLRCRSVEEAQAEGKKHGQLCARYGLTRWYADAEAEWAGVASFSRTPEPYRALRAYALSWRIYAPPLTELAYNGFSWTRTSDGRKLHDDLLMGAFDVWAPMCYGTSRAALERTVPGKIRKYRDLRPCPMFGVGREDENRNVWGFWDTHLELMRAADVDEFCWFFGNGAREQWAAGNREHPAVVDIARGLLMDEDECA